jgi:hypothetical protein
MLTCHVHVHVHVNVHVVGQLHGVFLVIGLIVCSATQYSTVVLTG